MSTQPQTPGAMVLVPREQTPAMLVAYLETDGAVKRYKAMIGAAPAEQMPAVGGELLCETAADLLRAYKLGEFEDEGGSPTIEAISCKSYDEHGQDYDADAFMLGFQEGVYEHCAPLLARIAELERVLGGMLFAFDDGVGRDWSAPLLDRARKQCKAVEYVAQPAAPVAPLVMAEGYEHHAHQGIPGTSFQALNAKANAGDL